ncbi:hypothetical protein EBR66_08225 [bacterium]|nr:hypothetical protein [bacterium]
MVHSKASRTIRRRKEVIMPTTQVPPEGTFNTYYQTLEQHEWWFNLPENAKSIMRDIVIEPQGYGSCNCGYLGELFGYSYVFECLCKRCVQHSLFNLIPQLSGIRENRWLISYDRYLPHNEFPAQQTTRINCAGCNEIILEPSDHRIHPDSPYVTSSVILRSDGDTVNVHTRCLATCYECEKQMVTSRGNCAFYEGHPICEMCLDTAIDNDDATQCYSCAEYFSSIYYCEYRNASYCNSCYQESFECSECGSDRYSDEDHECYYEPNAYIQSYGHRPAPKFYGQDVYYFGIELEVEDTQDYGCEAMAEKLTHKLDNRFYYKHDASLDNGFEIVSHPHSLDAWQKSEWDFLRLLRVNGFRSWDTSTCGLHVHVSRTAFRNFGKRDEAHELRFQKLIYDNQSHVQAIAGRSTDYASFMDKGKLVRKVKYGSTADRREAVNVTNDHTIEIRVFRGSLNKERVLSAVEFVHSAIEYTRSMKINPKAKQLSWVRFIAYVMDNQEKYPNFTQVALRALENVRIPQYVNTNESEDE